MKNSNLLLVISVLLVGCSSAKIVPFAIENSPKAPDYALEKNWAVLPDSYPGELVEIVGKQPEKEVDVFFVYPTLFTDKKDPAWNADITKPEIRNEVVALSVVNQASAFAAAGNLYVPFYRQAHYRVFDPKLRAVAGDSWEIAYSDVQRAFEYYLKHYNKGRGIIIAGHSQGSMHASKLVKDYFDGTALQSQLVAAYLPGAAIEPIYYNEIEVLDSPKEIGGIISWNTYKEGKLPKRYETYYKGRLTINPITWDLNTLGTFEQHKGLLYYDQEIYAHSIEIELIDGMVWASLPKVPKRFFMSFIKNYHAFDINLFWKDISLNAAARSNQWVAKSASQRSN